MLREMSIRQFRDWVRYAELDPFDEQRMDYRIASVVAAVVNSQRSRKQRKMKLSEALLRFGDASDKRNQRKQTWQEQLMIAKMYAVASQTSKPNRKRKHR